MITPVNGHVLIEPVQKPSFMQTERGKYQEIGVVVDFDKSLYTSYLKHGSDGSGHGYDLLPTLKAGDKVYFDSWLAAKYPKGVSEADGFYWLVEWKNIRAVEYGK